MRLGPFGKSALFWAITSLFWRKAKQSTVSWIQFEIRFHNSFKQIHSKAIGRWFSGLSEHCPYSKGFCHFDLR